MILIIAEKPSMGSAIAGAISSNKKSHDGYIECGEYCVTWCFGHLVEMAAPEVYGTQYKKWDLDTLPIIPSKISNNWIYTERKDAVKQLKTIEKLINKSSQIIHAGDPDREGQLLVDELFNFFKLSPEKVKDIRRLIVADLTPQAIRDAFNKIGFNKDYVPLSTSALARSRADWIYGINLSRLCTILGQNKGYKGVLSVGRVQTPLLGLIVRRDLSIYNFVSQDHYSLMAKLVNPNEDNSSFTTTWQFDKEGEGTNSEGLMISLDYVNKVIDQLSNKPAIVKLYKERIEEERQPLCYSLSDLQYDAAVVYNMSAQEVLDTAQSLYEKHKLITYPRSDTPYLTELQYKNRSNVLQSIYNNVEVLQSYMQNNGKFDSNIKSFTWNDKEVEVHHAIIPTNKQYSIDNLSLKEKNIYCLIALRYLVQFYPVAKFNVIDLKLSIDKEIFVAKNRQCFDYGWKQVKLKTQSIEQVNKDEEKNVNKNIIPPLKLKQQLEVLEFNIDKKKTKPLSHFSNASIIKAMTGISRFVSNPELKKILRETDGLGTEATRSTILELLFKRGFLERKGKNIIATQSGINFINSLPDNITNPDMTAYWEMQLNKIVRKQYSYREFMNNLEEYLEGLIQQLRQDNNIKI